METREQQHADTFVDDLIFEVLTRLPVRSLLRFRCVSKTWSLLISTPLFVEAHFRRSSTRPALLISFFHPRQGQFSSSLIYHNPKQSQTIPTQFEFLPPTVSLLKPQSVNGLMLFENEESLIVYNPNNRDCLTIPPQKPSEPDLHACCISNFLMYDPVGKVHKVLRTSLLSKYDDLSKLCHDIRVFTIGEHSWRRVAEDEPLHYIDGNAICVNGVLYYKGWKTIATQSVAYGYLIIKPVLVAFDIRLEKFQLFDDEDYHDLHPVLRDPVTLIDYGGRLGAVYYKKQKGECIMDLWILEDPIQMTCSTRRILLPAKWGDLVGETPVYVVGTINNIGETQIILAKASWISSSPPFCVFYHNMKSDSVRKVEVPVPARFGCQIVGSVRDPMVIFIHHVETLFSFSGLN